MNSLIMKPSYTCLLQLGLVAASLLPGCYNRAPSYQLLPKNVKPALDKSGPNRSELLRVIAHYNEQPSDSLKLRAAYFLIANMDHLYYYQGKLLEDYLDYFVAVQAKEGYTGRLNRYQLDTLYGPFSYDKLEKKYDVQEITTDQLEENIESAFKVWQEQPWGKNYDFSQFCEYILPYKMGNEQPEYNRAEIGDQYTALLRSVDSANTDPLAACTFINNELRKKGWFLLVGTAFLPHFPVSKLIRYQAGACREQADLGAYVFRSIGIPTSIDFIPQWPTRSMGHDFNAVIDPDGKPVMFGTADEDPGFSRLMDAPKGKVYRRTYEKNEQSLAVVRSAGEFIPEFMKDAYFRDVTDQYVACRDILVPLHEVSPENGQYRHAYLCVFNSSEWVPIHWGNIHDEAVLFSKMENNIVYLPAYFGVSGVVSASYPFVLTKDWRLRFLIPDSNKLINSLRLRQVFPAIPHHLESLEGVFQGANTPDFCDPQDLYNVGATNSLQHMYNGVKINRARSFRYVRYYNRRQCIIGEMEFYSGNRKLSGKVLSSGPSLDIQDFYTREKAVDGDPGTSFISLGGKAAWVGVDLERPRKIDSIRFSPGISVFGPRCYVVPGHRYALQYWIAGHWAPIGVRTARDASVTFSGLPSGALYHLHDLTKMNEERCFTIEGGKVQWW